MPQRIESRTGQIVVYVLVPESPVLQRGIGVFAWKEQNVERRAHRRLLSDRRMNRLLSGTAAVLVLASAAGSVSAAPDEEKLGKAEGYPLCPLTSLAPPDEKCLVGMLSHFDTLVPARRGAKGPTVPELKRPAQPAKIQYKYQDR